MDLIALIASYGGWAWVIGGLVLLGVELVVPGGIFVWLGLAALVTGVIGLFELVSVPLQWALFGVLSVIGIAGWLNWSRRQKQPESDRPFLNKRADALIGRSVVLIDPIVSGYGTAKVDDTVWQVSGPDLEAGQLVHVIGAKGTVLSVEPAAPVGD